VWLVSFPHTCYRVATCYRVGSQRGGQTVTKLEKMWEEFAQHAGDPLKAMVEEFMSRPFFRVEPLSISARDAHLMISPEKPGGDTYHIHIERVDGPVATGSGDIVVGGQED